MKKTTLLIALYTLLCLPVLAQTSSDTCADADLATPITGPGLYTVAAIDGSEIPSPICAENGTSAQLEYGEWYRYTPSASAFITISSDSGILPQNNGVDTRVHIYTGVCGSLVCVDGDDDSGAGFTSIVSFNATGGETYYIAWDDRWDESGFDFQLSEGAAPPPAPVTFTSQTVSATGSDRATVDMNNDHLDDLVSVTSTNININYQLPGGGFNSVNITTDPAPNTPSWSLSAGDLNRDGYNDLLYAGGSGVTFMISNSTGTAYDELSGPEDIFSQRSNFIDINNDGILDAFVCHDVEPNVYYINDINVDAGPLDYAEPGSLKFFQGASAYANYGLGTHPQGGNYGTVWVDYDNDRDMDMFIAKCRGGNIAHKWNELWRNDGSNTFINVADGFGYYNPAEGHDNSSNLGDPIQTWSSAWADFDNDGDMDVYVGASSSADGGHKLMQNDGDGTFSDITAGSGVTTAPYGIENAPGDFDNDGFVDILTNGSILFNNGDGTFTLQDSGMPPSGPIGDLNDDGYLDVFNGNVRFNNGWIDTDPDYIDASNNGSEPGNSWLKVVTVGTISNLNGIGARVEIESPTIGKQIRDVRSGEGFRYMSSLNTHFGLHRETAINSVTVYWPSGTIDIILNPAINSTLTITEGETLSLESSLVENLILYPNPTRSILNLNATYGFEDAIYSVFDMNGKRVMNSRFNDNIIDVSELNSGNYILRIVQGNLIKSQKFIKY